MAPDTERIQNNVCELQKALKKMPERSSPEEIHHLRTHTRRLEATLEALSLDSQHNEKRLLRLLGRIRKRAGKVRDRDVLTSHLLTIRVNGDRDRLVQLFEYLGSERYEHAARLHGLIRKYAAEILWRLKRTSNRLEELLDQNDESSLQSQAVANAMASAMSLSCELPAPTTLNRSNLHAYRLRIKELLYVLQMADDAGHEKIVASLGKIKDAIGEWHDWEELIAIAIEVLNHGPDCGLLRELKAINERKYKFALSITNKMRKDYCRSSDRNTRSGSRS